MYDNGILSLQTLQIAEQRCAMLVRENAEANERIVSLRDELTRYRNLAGRLGDVASKCGFVVDKAGNVSRPHGAHGRCRGGAFAAGAGAAHSRRLRTSIRKQTMRSSEPMHSSQRVLSRMRRRLS